MVYVKVSEKSWAKSHNDKLLSHETGHYIIGCLCAIEFKVRLEATRFSMNYKEEI
jgi:hypothetical protein